MKKLILILAVLAFAFQSQGQLLIKHVAQGAKGVDSLTGGATATPTTMYYYMNLKESIASGKIKSTTSVTNYGIYAIQVSVTPGTSPLDSAHITHEFSFDNTNWFKWSNGGATTHATQTQYEQGGPILSGTGVYTYVPDLVTVTTTAGGATFFPKGEYVPYERVKIVAYKVAYDFINVYYTLKPIE